MTTGERETLENVAQQPVESAEHSRGEPERQPAEATPRYRRAPFWRAVGGMALAIAFGWAAVASEIASELSSRNTSLYRLVESLRSRISELRIEVIDAERRDAATRAELATSVEIDSVLSAPDLIVLRLRPPSGTSAHGLLAISKQTETAIVELAGMSTETDKACTLWWLLAQGDEVRANLLHPDAKGRLSSAISMPPRGIRIVGAIITLEPGKHTNKPKGRLVLEGALANPQIL
jgi:anti-sigma-K factor RskA